MMQHMLNETNGEFGSYLRDDAERDFLWETSSLEYLVSGSVDMSSRVGGYAGSIRSFNYMVGTQFGSVGYATI